MPISSLSGHDRNWEQTAKQKQSNQTRWLRELSQSSNEKNLAYKKPLALNFETVISVVQKPLNSSSYMLTVATREVLDLQARAAET